MSAGSDATRGKRALRLRSLVSLVKSLPGRLAKPHLQPFFPRPARRKPNLTLTDAMREALFILRLFRDCPRLPLADLTSCRIPTRSKQCDTDAAIREGTIRVIRLGAAAVCRPRVFRNSNRDVPKGLRYSTHCRVRT